jgi:hypothetical protein
VSAVFFDQVGTFTEPGVIFGAVAAGFGDVIVQVEKDFIADDLFVIGTSGVFHPLQG